MIGKRQGGFEEKRGLGGRKVSIFISNCWLCLLLVHVSLPLWLIFFICKNETTCSARLRPLNKLMYTKMMDAVTHSQTLAAAAVTVFLLLLSVS